MGNSKSRSARDLVEYSRRINKFDYAICLLDEKADFVTLNVKMMELLGLSPLLQVSDIPNHKPRDYFPKKFGIVSEVVVGKDVLAETFEHALDRAFRDPLGRTHFYWCHEFHSTGEIFLSEVIVMALRHIDAIYAQAAVLDVESLTTNPDVELKTLQSTSAFRDNYPALAHSISHPERFPYNAGGEERDAGASGAVGAAAPGAPEPDTR